MPNRLFIEEIVSVGAVDDGDNPESEISFWKKRTKPSIIRKQSRTTVLPTKGDRMAEFDFDGFSDEQKTAVEAIFTEYENTIANLEQPEPEKVDVTKDASPELQELIAKKNDELLAKDAQLAEAQTELAKQKQAHRDTEFAAKANELSAVLSGDTDWGPVLDKLEAGAPDEFALLEAQLTVTKAAVETGVIFEELGKSGEGTDKLAALAKAKMELDPSMTVEQARAQVYLENPELVEEARS